MDSFWRFPVESPENLQYRDQYRKWSIFNHLVQKSIKSWGISYKRPGMNKRPRPFKQKKDEICEKFSLPDTFYCFYFSKR